MSRDENNNAGWFGVLTRSELLCLVQKWAVPGVGVGWDGSWGLNQINWMVQGVDADWHHLLCFAGAVPGLLQPVGSWFCCLVFFFIPEKCPFAEVVFGYCCPEQENDSWLSWELPCHCIFPVKRQPGIWQRVSSALRRQAQNPKHCFGGFFFFFFLIIN